MAPKPMQSIRSPVPLTPPGSGGRQRPLTNAAASWGGLLIVALEHLIAGLADLEAILLQAGQNGEIALIHHRTAKLLDVARTSGLFLGGTAAGLVGGGRDGDREQQQGKCQQ